MTPDNNIRSALLSMDDDKLKILSLVTGTVSVDRLKEIRKGSPITPAEHIVLSTLQR